MAHIYIYDATELDTEQLNAEFSDTDHTVTYVAESILPANCQSDAEVISVFVTSKVTREIIESLPNLKLIACRSTGFDHIDLEAAKEHNVTVVNVPVYGETTVAEYTFTLMTALMRKLPATLALEHESFSAELLRGNDLEGKTLGVIGTGHIGRKVLKIAGGFSMNLIAYDAFPNPDLESTHNFTYVDLEELVKQADIVTLHAPYLPATHHILNHERLSAMKKDTVIVNTARGELIDTKALTELLANGHLGGAALDVVEGEALMHYRKEKEALEASTPDNEMLLHDMEISLLKKMPNVILTPHNAFNTIEAIGRINHTTAKNIADFWNGDTPNKIKN